MKRTFTLIELIVVIAVLGILSSIVIPNIMNIKDKSITASISSNMKSLQAAVDMYQNDHFGLLPIDGDISIINPKPIDISKLKSDQIRKFSTKEYGLYWLDINGTVWASHIDAPIIESVSNQTLHWNSVKEAEKYHVYEVINYQDPDHAITATAHFKKLKLVDTTTQLSSAKVEVGKTYLVSAVDSADLETVPVGLGYKGYTPITEETPNEGPNQPPTEEEPTGEIPPLPSEQPNGESGSPLLTIDSFNKDVYNSALTTAALSGGIINGKTSSFGTVDLTKSVREEKSSSTEKKVSLVIKVDKPLGSITDYVGLWTNYTWNFYGTNCLKSIQAYDGTQWTNLTGNNIGFCRNDTNASAKYTYLGTLLANDQYITSYQFTFDITLQPNRITYISNEIYYRYYESPSKNTELVLNPIDITNYTSIELNTTQIIREGTEIKYMYSFDNSIWSSFVDNKITNTESHAKLYVKAILVSSTKNFPSIQSIHILGK